MKCAELEILICEYLDGVLAADERSAVDKHLSSCPACAELARDAAAAVSFLEMVPEVEPPDELVTRILYKAPGGAEPAVETRDAARSAGGFAHWIRGWLAPVLQPRFAMGMAMTILSFSMVGRIVGLEQRQLRMEDLNPAKVWAAIDDKLHRTYDRAVKYYENLRLVYEIQSRLREWSDQEEEFRRSQAGGAELQPSQAPAAAEGEPERGNP
ncbi:MAG: hypothetical protein FJW20_13210 [Acidimicrobiia bacterium]|nr:hypothetical protein [Acidimicrobiia bacterium]